MSLVRLGVGMQQPSCLSLRPQCVRILTRPLWIVKTRVIAPSMNNIRVYGKFCVTRQEVFPMLSGHDTHLKQAAWSKDTRRGEVGQFAAWLFAEHVVS